MSIPCCGDIGKVCSNTILGGQVVQRASKGSSNRDFGGHAGVPKCSTSWAFDARWLQKAGPDSDFEGQWLQKQAWAVIFLVVYVWSPVALHALFLLHACTEVCD